MSRDAPVDPCQDGADAICAYSDSTAIELRDALDHCSSDERRNAMLEELNRHEREVTALSRALSDLRHPPGRAPARAGNAHTVLLTADITKHRISIALLAAQLLRLPA